MANVRYQALLVTADEVTKITLELLLEDASSAMNSLSHKITLLFVETWSTWYHNSHSCHRFADDKVKTTTPVLDLERRTRRTWQGKLVCNG